MNEELGDRCKQYEAFEAQRRFMPLLPIMVRVDGRSFSSFTRGLARPYDGRLSQLMQQTTRYLVQEVGACIGYTQSDEISLVIPQERYDAQIYFGGRIQKMVSQIAAQASTYFNRSLPEFLPEKVKLMPTFDCRVWQVPNRTEAVNTLIWREIDASKNSIQTLARWHFSHKELMNRGCTEMLDMLEKKGILWQKEPDFFKRGSYIQRKVVERSFTAAELTNLPPKHEAHANPSLTVSRTDYIRISMPPLNRVINRDAVIFNGEDPVQESSQ